MFRNSPCFIFPVLSSGALSSQSLHSSDFRFLGATVPKSKSLFLKSLVCQQEWWELILQESPSQDCSEGRNGAGLPWLGAMLAPQILLDSRAPPAALTVPCVFQELNPMNARKVGVLPLFLDRKEPAVTWRQVMAHGWEGGEAGVLLKAHFTRILHPADQGEAFCSLPLVCAQPQPWAALKECK